MGNYCTTVETYEVDSKFMEKNAIETQEVHEEQKGLSDQKDRKL